MIFVFVVFFVDAPWRASWKYWTSDCTCTAYLDWWIEEVFTRQASIVERIYFVGFYVVDRDE